MDLVEALVNKMTADLEKNLSAAGITESGVVVPNDELAQASISGMSGFGGMGSIALLSALRKSGRGKARKVPVRATQTDVAQGRVVRAATRKDAAESKKVIPGEGSEGTIVRRVSEGDPVVEKDAMEVKQSDIVAALKPTLKDKARQMARGLQKATKKIIAETPASAKTLPVNALNKLRQVMTEEIIEDLPESAVTGGRFFGLDDFVTAREIDAAPSVSGSAIGAAMTPMSVDFDMGNTDLDTGAAAFGSDIERGAAVFGSDIDSGAAAFSDFITASEVDSAATVSGFGSDIDRGASAFGGDLDTGAVGFGGDLDTGAVGFGMGAMVKHAGATRDIFTDTWVDYPERDWSDMRYPKELPFSAPTPQNTAAMATVAAKKGVEVLKETGSPAKAMAAVSAMGVKPQSGGIGKPRTAGEAAYKPVQKGLAKFYKKWRGTRGASARAKLLRPSGVSGFEGDNF